VRCDFNIVNVVTHLMSRLYLDFKKSFGSVYTFSKPCCHKTWIQYERVISVSQFDFNVNNKKLSPARVQIRQLFVQFSASRNSIFGNFFGNIHRHIHGNIHPKNATHKDYSFTRKFAVNSKYRYIHVIKLLNHFI